ncbi:hypothetical protein EJ06DRAFT_495658, partial [Trichodelitschia bisporula]
MSPSTHLSSFPSAKRKRHNNDSDYDLEKSSPSPQSAYSSRASSASHAPMLRSPSPSPSPSRGARAHAYAPPPRRPWCQCSPRAGGRIFSLALISTVVLFMLALTRQHYASIRSVETGEMKPPPPPHVWEAFPFLQRYHGGVRALVPREKNVPEYPAREDTKEEVGEEEKEPVKRTIPMDDVPFDPYPGDGPEPCFVDAEKRVRVPAVRAFPGVPKGMPDHIFGSYDIFGLRNDVCFERYGRLGPYGLGYSKKKGGSGSGMDGDREGADKVWEGADYVDYRKVHWADAQRRCEDANRHRLRPSRKGPNHFYQTMAVGGPEDEPPIFKSAEGRGNVTGMGEDGRQTFRASDRAETLLPRTAVVIRTWHDYDYDAEDLFFLRSLVHELALQTGGAYTVHFLIHVKDDNLQIWAEDEVYQRVLNASLPAEFRGMGTLWSERQMSLIYGGLHESHYRDLPVHGAYRSTWQPVTYFARQHPEYDFFWQFEMDMRYTGHWFHLLDRVGSWAKAQPRKGLWERNARFYVPAEHGTWEDFSHMVRVQTEHGTASKGNIYAALAHNPDVPAGVKEEMASAGKPEKPVWGPEPPVNDELDSKDDVRPPGSEKADKGTWGVGEEADLVVFNPLFDPAGTGWLLAEDVTGYNTSQGLPPRRAAINTFGRYSRKLLMRMHGDTVFGRKSMFSEMWPASCALHHGFKAVYAPHPVYIDRVWPTGYLARVFNGGRNGASGGARSSVFTEERQHHFLGTSWYYHAGFAPNVWKRWMGYRVDADGGERYEVEGEGRMCLPAMLVHPVKQVDLVFE